MRDIITFTQLPGLNLNRMGRLPGKVAKKGKKITNIPDLLQTQASRPRAGASPQRISKI
jgi:hypothetical protein